MNDDLPRPPSRAPPVCAWRGRNYDVEIEHCLVKLCEAPDADTARILKHYGVDPASSPRDLTRALDRLKTGNARTPTLSPRLTRC